MKDYDKDLKFKFFSWLYFPVQYLILRFLILGVSLQPTLLDIWTGFRFEQIITVVTDFIKNLDEVLTVEHISFIILNIIPYLIRLIWESRNIILFAYASIALIIFIVGILNNQSYKNSIDNNSRVVTYIGAPGSGKTSRMLYDAVIRSKNMWVDLQVKYHTYKNKLADWKKEGNKKALNEWEEIRDSYIYWSTSDCVPCLMTNIPVIVNQQFTTILTWKHAYQQERVPYYAVLVFDESGATFLVDDYKDKPLEVSDFFRCERHFGDWYIYLTEQDSANQYIDVRRVVGHNEFMLGQKWVIKPLPLLLIYSIFKRIVLSRDKCGKRLANVMMFLSKCIGFVGFRKYKCVKEKNTERAGLYERIRVNKIYLPTYLNCIYDDRTFREFYQAKDLELNLEVHKSLILPKTDENELCFLRSSASEQIEQQRAEQESEALLLADKALTNITLKKQVKELIAQLDEKEKLKKSILKYLIVKQAIEKAS